MTQSFYPVTLVEVTPGIKDAWTDVDVSAYIPVGSTGVILEVENVDTNHLQFGVRKNGSTDDRHTSMARRAQFWVMIGVDANRRFETYIQTEIGLTGIRLHLVGYTVSGVTFFTNAYDKTPAAGSWQDVDCSVEAPGAIGLIFELRGGGGFGFRKNGSSDSRVQVPLSNVSWAVIGCDASQICEAYLTNIFQYAFLVGYITDGATFKTNGVDKSLGSTGSYQDIDCSSDAPAGLFMIFEVYTTATARYGLRKNGEVYDIYRDAEKHNWAVVESDVVQIVEGKIENLAVDFFLVGYTEGGVLPPSRRARSMLMGVGK